MDWKFIFHIILAISSIHVDATTVNRICFIPEIKYCDDMNMLELSLIVSNKFYEKKSPKTSLNKHLLSLYKSNGGLNNLLIFYRECIKHLFKRIQSTLKTTPEGNENFLDLLMTIMILCTELQSEKYVSFHRDVDKLMSEYEQYLIDFSTTKKCVKKTYLLEHFTACVCKEVQFETEYYNILACSNIFIMNQNTMCYILVNNFAKLNQISTNRDAKDLCIELVIDEAQLLNIIYDFEYKKLFTGTLKLRNAARAPNSTFNDFLKSMFPELTTSNRFTNIVYMAWTDIEEKIDFYFRHAKYDVLRDCSKKCFMERLTTIKTHLNAVLLDKKHPLNNQDKPMRYMHLVSGRIYVF